VTFSDTDKKKRDFTQRRKDAKESIQEKAALNTFAPPARNSFVMIYIPQSFKLAHYPIF
jgi:hypothetical protein